MSRRVMHMREVGSLTADGGYICWDSVTGHPISGQMFSLTEALVYCRWWDLVATYERQEGLSLLGTTTLTFEERWHDFCAEQGWSFTDDDDEADSTYLATLPERVEAYVHAIRH